MCNSLHYSATVNAQNRGFSCGEDDENGSGTDDECCANLELTLENDASDNQGQRAGSYEIQAENFNDRNDETVHDAPTDNDPTDNDHIELINNQTNYDIVLNEKTETNIP